MSDLFHADVPDSFVARVFDVMERAPQHEFQILTKRAERLARLAPRLPWSANVWIGVSVELPAFYWRIDCLRRVPAAVRFISAEQPIPAISLLEHETPISYRIHLGPSDHEIHLSVLRQSAQRRHIGLGSQLIDEHQRQGTVC